MHIGDLIFMPEIPTELQTLADFREYYERSEKEKEEMSKKEKRDNILVGGLVCVVVAFFIGYAIGYQYGAFEGFQLALKQFHIIPFAPVLIP